MSTQPNRWMVNLLRLNRRQTSALITGILVFVVFGFFPPWNHVYVNELGGRRVVHAGHGGVMAPPSPMSTYNYYATNIDVVRLLILWVVVAGVTYGVVVGMADRNTEADRLLRRYERE